MSGLQRPGAARRVALCLTLLVATAWLGADDASAEGQFSFPATVVRVLGGNAVEARIGSAAPRLVRLIGVAAPRGNACAAPQATALLTRLALGKRVTLRGDPAVRQPSHGAELLAYVDRGPTDLGGRLIVAGLARARAMTPAPARLPGYLRAEAQAQQAIRGLWNLCPGTLLPRPPAAPVAKTGRRLLVSSATELTAALAGLRDGDHIVVAAGVYSGEFVVRSKRLRQPGRDRIQAGRRAGRRVANGQSAGVRLALRLQLRQHLDPGR